MEPKADPHREGKDVKLDIEEANSVWWNEPADEDPENPMAWSNKRKWGIIAMLSLLSFLT